MRFHIRVDESSPTRCRLTLFIDGANCGQLTVNSKEALEFVSLVKHGCDTDGHAFEFSPLFITKAAAIAEFGDRLNLLLDDA